MLPKAELKLAARVWSRSLSSRDAASVTWRVSVPTTTGMIWFLCGDSSFSQRTFQEWFALIW